MDDILFNIIIPQSSFKDKINWMQVCKSWNINIIKRIYNIPHRYEHRLTNDILQKFKFLKKINVSDNIKITDNGLKILHLHTLVIYNNSTITDDAIKNMKLSKLKINYKSIITDNAIKSMPLQTLCIFGNCNITDNGIKNTPLKKLLISGSHNITCDIINYMQLEQLHIIGKSSKNIKIKNAYNNYNKCEVVSTY